MFVSTHGIVARAGTSGDADAQAFITAAGITDSTQQSAIQTLVTDLKGYGIWTKMKAIYPFVGGTASTHKWNLKDPQDTDAAFRLVFNGGWTHSSTGALPNGTNAYADSKLNPSSILSSNSSHLSHYSRTQVINTNSHDIGCETGGGTNNLDLFQYYSAVSNKGYIDGSYPTDAAENNNTDTTGFLIGSRTSSTSLKIYFENSLLNTNTNTKTLGYPNYNIFIGATNQAGGAGAYSTKECAFASIGDGLTDTEAGNFYTAVNAFQTTLSRNV